MKLQGLCGDCIGLYRVEGRNGKENRNYYNGLYRDYYKDPFLLPSLLANQRPVSGDPFKVQGSISWVDVKELNDFDKETLVFSIYPYYGEIV